MGGHNVYFKASVEKDFRTIPVKDIKKILQKIQLLAVELRPPGCEKLTGLERYRARQARYRILYSIQDCELTVWVVKIGRRKDIYR